MPGVNRICNTKMSLIAGIFELLLRRDAALRNIPHPCAFPRITALRAKVAARPAVQKALQAEGFAA